MGVVSRGKSCTRKNNPGIYTRVKKYLNWIKNITEKEGKCYKKDEPGKNHDQVNQKGNWIGCECQTIVITFLNGALSQSQRQGIYQRAGKVNGKTSWISSNNNALWYNPPVGDWFIGDVEDLGNNTGYITSTGHQGRSSCPYNVSKDAWDYWNHTWISAEANDVSIDCLTGKEPSINYFVSVVGGGRGGGEGVIIL